MVKLQKTYGKINMFLEQVAQNATTWSGTLQELSNIRVEFKQGKENMYETHNCLQNCSLKLNNVKKFEELGLKTNQSQGAIE